MSKGGTEIGKNDLKKGLLSIVEELKEQPDALLSILHNIQSLFGYVPMEAVPLIAGTLKISHADVHAVISKKDMQKGLLSIIEELKDHPGALLPILHNIQSLFGYVPEEAIPLIASTLNLSRADVHGVISFYHHFRSEKPGTHVIQVCRAESCQAMGSVALERHVKESLKIDYHQTTDNGEFSLEPVYCLGNCACSPSIAIADEVYGDMDADKFDELINSLMFTPEKTGAL